MDATNTTTTGREFDRLIEQAVAKRFEELDWADQWETYRGEAIRNADKDLAAGTELTAHTRYCQSVADAAFCHMQTAARETERLIDQAAGNPFHTPDYKQRRADIAAQVDEIARKNRIQRDLASMAIDDEDTTEEDRDTATAGRDLVDTLFNQALSWLNHIDGDDFDMNVDRNNGFIYVGEVGIDLNAIAELITKKGA